MTSVSKDPSSNDISNEESGWTTYFEDFFNNNNIDDNNQHKSSLSLSRVASSSSLVSDATSLIEKNVAHIVEDEEEVSVNKNGKESSFKKRKNITDDALEDTATSPLNSPKVKFNFLLLLFSCFSITFYFFLINVLYLLKII